MGGIFAMSYYCCASHNRGCATSSSSLHLTNLSMYPIIRSCYGTSKMGIRTKAERKYWGRRRGSASSWKIWWCTSTEESWRRIRRTVKINWQATIKWSPQNTAQIAKKIRTRGCSKTSRNKSFYFQKLEQGRSKAPSEGVLTRIADALGIDEEHRDDFIQTYAYRRRVISEPVRGQEFYGYTPSSAGRSGDIFDSKQPPQK